MRDKEEDAEEREEAAHIQQAPCPLHDQSWLLRSSLCTAEAGLELQLFLPQLVK